MSWIWQSNNRNIKISLFNSFVLSLSRLGFWLCFGLWLRLLSGFLGLGRRRFCGRSGLCFLCRSCNSFLDLLGLLKLLYFRLFGLALRFWTLLAFLILLLHSWVLLGCFFQPFFFLELSFPFGFVLSLLLPLLSCSFFFSLFSFISDLLLFSPLFFEPFSIDLLLLSLLFSEFIPLLLQFQISLSSLLPPSFIPFLPSKAGAVFLCKAVLLQNFFLILSELLVIFLQPLDIGINSITVIKFKAIIIDFTLILIGKLLLILVSDLRPIFWNDLIDFCWAGVFVLLGILMVSLLDEAGIG